MIEIDGSCGEGGGQILRTSLSLAALTGQPVRVTKIRAKRRKPGLMRQHLLCAQAVAQISGGLLEGAELNAQELTFVPGNIQSGEYRFAVGSAGSAVLIAQAVLPLLLHAQGVSRVEIEGGTHAAHAPVFDYFERVYLPCLRRMGAGVEAALDRIGFYPAGGGKITLTVSPVHEWKYLEIMESGLLKKARLVALGSGIDTRICTDELSFCRAALGEPGVFQEEIHTMDAPCSGNVLFAELESELLTELFSVCGERGVSRRSVGERVAGMVNEYRNLNVPVGQFLADQLLLPMVLGAGGKFRTSLPSSHTRTNIDVIGKFTDAGIEIENRQNGQYIIEVKK